MAEGSRLKHEIMLYVEQLSEGGNNFRAAELFQRVDKIHTKMVMQEMSAAEYVVLLKDILAEIAFDGSNRRAYVLAKKESEQSVKNAENESVEIVERSDDVSVKKLVKNVKKAEAKDVEKRVDVFTCKESKKEGDQVRMTDQEREIGVFTQKENKEKAYVFACKESNEAREEVCSEARLKMKDHGEEEANQVIRSEDHGKEEVREEAKGGAGPAVKDHDTDEARGEARPMVRDRDVESKEEIIAGELKGGERPRGSATDEKEIVVFTWKESKEEVDRVEKADQGDAGRVEKADPEVVESKETVGVEQPIVENGVGQAKKLFRSLEQSFEGPEEGGEEILVDSKERRDGQKKKTRLLVEDCSTVGVRTGRNAHGKDGEAVRSDVVRGALEEEVLKAEDIVLKIKKKPIQFEDVKSDLIGVIEVENVERIWDKNASKFNRKPRTSRKFNVEENILAISQTGKESDMENGDPGDNMKHQSLQNKSKEQNCKIDNVADPLVKCLKKNQQLNDQAKMFKSQSKNLKLESKQLISIEANRQTSPRKGMKIVEEEKIELSNNNISLEASVPGSREELPKKNESFEFEQQESKEICSAPVLSGSSLVNNEGRDENIKDIANGIIDSAVGATSKDIETAVKDILGDMVQNISDTSDLLDNDLQKDETVDTAKLMDDTLTTVNFNKVKTAKDIEVIQVKVNGDKYIKAKKPFRDKSKDETDESTPVKIDLQSFKFSKTVNNSPTASESKFGLDTEKCRKKCCGLGNLVKHQSEVKKPLLLEAVNEKREKLDHVELYANLAVFSFVETIKDKEKTKAVNSPNFASCTFVKPGDVKIEEVGPECIGTSSKDPKECFANLFHCNIPAGNNAKFEYNNVKVDKIDVKHTGGVNDENDKDEAKADENGVERVKATVIANEEIQRIDVVADAKAVKVVQVAVNEKEFGNVIAHTKLGIADEKKLDEKYVKVKIVQSKHGKVKVDEIVGKYADGFCVKIDKDTVKADKRGVKYVEVSDDKNTGNENDTKENDEARASASQFVRCVANVSKSVDPVWRHSQPSVEKDGAGVFDAVSVVSKSVVGAEFVYSQEYRVNEHMYRDKYRMDGGRGARDLELFADVFLVEVPDALRLIMGHEYAEEYESAEYMHSEKYGMGSDQAAEVFMQPGRLDIAEQDSPLQRSFTGVSWVEEPSKLGQQDMQLARTIYNENQTGMVQEGPRVSWKSFPKWGCKFKNGLFRMLKNIFQEQY